MSTATPISYEPFGPGNRDTGIYQQLLDRAPVYRAEASGFYVISRHADVRDAARRTADFSSRPNQSEAMGMATDGDPSATARVIEQMTALTAGMPVSLEELMTSRMIVAADPPLHTHLRTVINRAFLPKKLGGWRDRIEATVSELTADLDGTRPFDVVERLAIPLPVSVIAEILSLGPDQHGNVKHWSDGIIGAAQGADRGTPEAAARVFGAFKEFVSFMLPLIEDRRQHPQDDVISTLVAKQEAESLTVADTLFFLLVVMAAGNETSTNIIGNTVVQLLRNPDQLQMVVDDPALLDNAIEETLRFRSPIQLVMRQATRDVEVGDERIPEGSLVALLLGAANRDPRVFDDPDRFDITRENAGSHVAFGHGIHFCIGAALARLEVRTAISAILPLLPSMRLAEEPEPGESLILDGYDRIVLEPR